MIKKIILLILVINLVACNTAKPVVHTTKTTSSKRVVVKKEPVKTIPNSSKKEEIVKANKPVETVELEATSNVKVTTDIVVNYISNFKKIAQDNMRNYKIPASIILAQGILESGSGVGDLALKANNHFGIKCHKEWTGESVRHDDDAAQECFRKYNEPAESFKDHALFLTSRPWYNNLFKLDISDYKAWSYGLKKSGYATDPKYPAKLIAIIERYQLFNYDSEVLGKPILLEKTLTEEIVNNSETYKVINSNANFHTVVKGDTLYSISKRYNISLDDLRKKNNISDNAISIGQNLIIQ
jgi:flagellum-specific peptidoglycan hydrolase FlgJ